MTNGEATLSKVELSERPDEIGLRVLARLPEAEVINTDGKIECVRLQLASPLGARQIVRTDEGGRDPVFPDSLSRLPRRRPPCVRTPVDRLGSG